MENLKDLSNWEYFWMQNKDKKLKKEDLLKCSKCGKPFVNAVDKITGKVSKNLYKPDCSCYDKEFRVCVG